MLRVLNTILQNEQNRILLFLTEYDFCLFLIRKIEIKLNLKCDKQLMKEKGEK